MTTKSYPILAREGWGHVGYALSAAVFVHWIGGFWWALPLWSWCCSCLQFFRDPPRPIPQDADVVVCPADGRVIAVDEVEDPYLKRRRGRISIFMNVFNVHSNRMPLAGEVKERWYNAGSFVNAALDKAARENERNALWIRTAGGKDVVVVQVAGLIAPPHPVLCAPRRPGSARRALRFHPLRLARRCVPAARCPAAVSLGDKTRAAARLLAHLLTVAPHTSATGRRDMGGTVEKQARKGIYILPNLFTTGALFAGFYAIVQAMNGNFEHGADRDLRGDGVRRLDGPVARWTTPRATSAPSTIRCRT